MSVVVCTCVNAQYVSDHADGLREPDGHRFLRAEPQPRALSPDKSPQLFNV